MAEENHPAAVGRQSSKLGNAFAASQNLLRSSHALDDVTNVVMEGLDQIQNGSSRAGTKKIELAITALKATKKKIIENTVKSTHKGGGASLSYAVNRIKRHQEKQQRLADFAKRPAKKGRLSASYKAVKEIAAESRELEKKQTGPARHQAEETSIHGSLARHTRPKQQQTVAPPNNLTMYSPDEVIKLSKTLPKRVFSQAKKDWIAKGMVGCKTLNGLNKMIQKVESGGAIPDEWGNHGRPVLLDVIDMEAIADQIATEHPGEACDQDMFAGIIKQHLRDKAVARGESDVGCHNVCDRTIDNYKFLNLSQGRQVPTNAVSVVKSMARWTSEGSLIGGMLNGLGIAASNVIMGEPPPDRLIPISLATEGARLLIRLVEEACAVDETRANEWYLVNKGDMKDKGYRGIRQQSDVQHMCGMRVKLTFLLSASGGMGPVLVSVLGLTEAELPTETCPEGVVLLKVPGLSVGAAVDAQNTSVGYVLFIRKNHESDVSVEAIKEKIYFEEVLLPHIERVRQQVDGYEPGSEVPDSMRCVLSMDGDIAQIKQVVQEESIDLLLSQNCIVNKQNAARTGTEQPVDLTPIFKLLKKLLRIMTMSYHTPLWLLLSRLLRELRHKLRLKPSHEAALLDFLATLPEMLQQTCTTSNIQEGFIKAGVIDSGSKQIPDVHVAVVGTTRRCFKEDVIANCWSTFPASLRLMWANGHIPDDILLQAGLPVDLDAEGNECHRPAGITNESQQRFKQLTHPKQVELRKKEFEKAQLSKQEKENQARLKILLSVKHNQKCEERLTSTGVRLSDASIEQFGKCTSDELKGFYLARDKVVPAGGWPSKGKASDALQGENNLIRIAWLKRELPVLVVDASPEPQLMDQQCNTNAIGMLQNLIVDPITVGAGRLSDAYFVLSNEWVGVIHEVFEHVRPFDGDIEFLQSQTGKLAKLLWGRLSAHIDTRIKDLGKANHWVWSFMRDNIFRFAAILVLHGHVHDNLDGYIAGRFRYETLLKMPYRDNCFIPLDETLEVAKLRGSYIVMDSNRCKWIRSGKVTRTFASRIQEHRKASKLRNESSKFYQSYPSKE